MTGEQGGGEIPSSSFTEEELEALANKSELFHAKFIEGPQTDELYADEKGNTVNFIERKMPYYEIDERRSIAVVAERDILDVLEGEVVQSEAPQHTVYLTDLVGDQQSDRALIFRQITLDLNQFSRVEYRNSLEISYSVMPANEEGYAVETPDRTPEMPEAEYYFRPFTRGDYEDVMQRLDTALEAQVE